MRADDVLETIEWGEREFGSLAPSRSCSTRDIRRAVAKGCARSIGLVPLCDDDGWLRMPERYREGYVLTDAGKARLASLREAATPTRPEEGAERC